MYHTRHNRGSERLRERIRNITESRMDERQERRVKAMCSGPE